MKITVPPRLKRVKKGDDGEVPEEVQRECSLLKLVWRGVLGTGVDKAKKRREFDLIVLTVAIVYIDLVCGNAFVNVACRILANCDRDLSLLPLHAEFHVPSTLPRVSFA